MGFVGKVEIPDGTDGGNVPSAMSDMATSIFTRIVNYYADTSERDSETAVPSKMSTAEKFGTVCWVGSLKGYFYWDGAAWVPLAVTRPAVASRPSAANTAVATPAEILNAVVTLPPGNRVVEVTSSCVVQAISGAGTGWSPRATLVGQNLSQGILGQTALPGLGHLDAYHGSWWLTCSGTVTYRLYIINAVGTGACSFTDSFITIIDHGPA